MQRSSSLGRPHMEARRESSNLSSPATTRKTAAASVPSRPQQRPLQLSDKRRRGAASREASVSEVQNSRVPLVKVASRKHVETMSSGCQRHGSVKPKLCPRREFGPAQDHQPVRHYSLRNHNGKPTSTFWQRRPKKTADDLLASILRTKKVTLHTTTICQDAQTAI